jgi:trimethylamine---corrinoid protein Co-methyltransferase
MHSATLKVWDADACRSAHAATLRVLGEIGVEMKHDEALALCAAAGARVEGTRVRLPGELVDQALRSAPRAFAVRPRGGGTPPLELRGGEAWFGTGPDCVYVRDPQSGERRRARLDDVRAAAALAEQLPNLDFVMSMGLPEDAPTETVDLVQLAAMLSATRKPIVVSSPFGASSHAIMQDMAEAAGGRDSLLCLAMSSPPLQLDPVACDKIIGCARLGLPLVLAGSVSAGSGGPVSLSACISVVMAETLAGLVLHQLARPGAPFVCGPASACSTCAPRPTPTGAPGAFLANQAQLDLIAHYGLPSWSYAGHSDSKLLDEQWALESAVATLLGALSRATLLHDVGYLESGLQSALEGMVLGDELAGFARALLEMVPVDDAGFAFDEIAAVGPGGDHLGRRMTREGHRRFWQPGVIDQASHERWQAAGSTTLLERVRQRLRDLRGSEPGVHPSTTTRGPRSSGWPRPAHPSESRHSPPTQLHCRTHAPGAYGGMQRRIGISCSSVAWGTASAVTRGPGTMDERDVTLGLLRGLLAGQRLGVLATHGEDGPYASLVAFDAADDLRRLTFSTTRATRKYQLLTAEPRVAMLIDSRSDDDVDFHEAVAVTAVGPVAELTGDERADALARYIARHPHLTGFAGAQTSALLALDVVTYYVVRRFQTVTELHMR